MSKKIVSFDYEPSSKRGGQELALFEVLKGLSISGYEVTLGYVKEGNLLYEYQKFGIKTIKIPILNINKSFSIKQWIELLKSVSLIKIY